MQFDRPISADAGALVSHGNALSRAHRIDEALACYEQAIALQPGSAVAHCNRANVLKGRGHFDEAMAGYDRAIACQPDFVLAHYNRGVLLEAMQRPAEALASYDRAIAIQPGLAQAHNNRGIVLAEFRRLDDARASYETALAIDPGFAEAYNNLGLVLADLKRFDDALANYAQAIALRPDYAEAHSNRGLLLVDLHRHDEALASYDRALAIAPNYATARTLKAELLLLRGAFAEGWELYESRWQSKFRPSRGQLAEIPVWTGQESVAGKAVLLVPEVGYGDFIMFIRYLPLLRERGARILIQTPKPLCALCAAMAHDVTIVEEGGAPPFVDLQCPIMSLPRAFGTTLQTIPAAVPYLQVPREREDRWRARLGSSSRPRVGLTWSGKPDRNVDRRPLRSRSLPLDLLGPMLRLPFEFHALQQEFSTADAAMLSSLPITTHQHALVDFADTAAVIQQMDLVISIDTSVANLAGALGKPMWVMLPRASDYRWGFAGDKTPWYPTATLFRQAGIEDWGSVVGPITQRLGKWPESV